MLRHRLLSLLIFVPGLTALAVEPLPGSPGTATPQPFEVPAVQPLAPLPGQQPPQPAPQPRFVPNQPLPRLPQLQAPPGLQPLPPARPAERDQSR